ncbi:uncharacterized protein LOC111712956 isoform X3 [Eurytemora carolleeae]|uniref:uncharacterized protein LOC111712956 isoform X3 n=1 Tax=Eurytemora carolleeae TaxID=1294199 RepID=UPI000C76D4E1|nr:uncharacterized protein LOC111712956 isoform X3 [Eurytemora carolleeae]|eukprot:XP_023343487.1 uncharacterized protein LOC111712956 isoform X3 [Eurytemora affinis]
MMVSTASNVSPNIEIILETNNQIGQVDKMMNEFGEEVLLLSDVDVILNGMMSTDSSCLDDYSSSGAGAPHFSSDYSVMHSCLTRQRRCAFKQSRE